MNPYQPPCESDGDDDMETDFELLHRKLEQATKAAFFYGAIVGLSAAALMIVVFIVTMRR